MACEHKSIAVSAVVQRVGAAIFVVTRARCAECGDLPFAGVPEGAPDASTPTQLRGALTLCVGAEEADVDGDLGEARCPVCDTIVTADTAGRIVRIDCLEPGHKVHVA